MKSIANYTNKKSYSKIKKLSDANLESIIKKTQKIGTWRS